MVMISKPLNPTGAQHCATAFQRNTDVCSMLAGITTLSKMGNHGNDTCLKHGAGVGMRPKEQLAVDIDSIIAL